MSIITLDHDDAAVVAIALEKLKSSIIHQHGFGQDAQWDEVLNRANRISLRITAHGRVEKR
jgi:hypothetical protein